MIDLQIRDLTLPPNDDKHIDFITITNEQWAMIKANIEMLKKHEKCELMYVDDFKKSIDKCRAEVIDEIDNILDGDFTISEVLRHLIRFVDENKGRNRNDLDREKSV